MARLGSSYCSARIRRWRVFIRSTAPRNHRWQPTEATDGKRGAGGRNRTDETCLEGRSFTTKLRPRGAGGQLRSAGSAVKPELPARTVLSATGESAAAPME